MSDTGRCWSFRKQNSWEMADYEALPSSAKFVGAPLSEFNLTILDLKEIQIIGSNTESSWLC